MVVHLGRLSEHDEIRGSYPGREFVERATGDLRVQCDARRIQQVLWNLLDNEVHHSDPTKPIALRAEGRQNAAVITVSSLGQPIPTESLPGIFDPMLRLAGTGQSATGHPLSGVGLGLYIVREIVRGHGGSVTVASDLENGTVVMAEEMHAAEVDKMLRKPGDLAAFAASQVGTRPAASSSSAS